MYRSLLLVVLLFLLPPDPSRAQTGPSKTPHATNQTDAKAVPVSKETNPEAKSLYDDGIERLEMGQVSEAVERFQKALKADPDYAQAYSALGRAFFKLKQWENASETFRRAMVLKAKERERQKAIQKNHIRTIPAIKLNKPLPINTAVAVTPLDSALQPPQVSIAQVNITFEDLPGEPPPEMRRIAEPVPEEPLDVAIINITPPVPSGELKTVSPPPPNSLTTTYRIGSQDVLEIRLNNSQPQQPTAFTVTQSGLVEHAELSEPLQVKGLTADEIRASIEDKLKNQASIDNPKVSVRVLDYASHSISVEGLVKTPGTKFLKSEAIPLGVVLAEAQPLREAATVTVARNGNQILETDLNHTNNMGTLVHPGDVVTLHPQISEVLYVSGKVKFPGEKRYRVGLTLMQAIITAGGATSNSGVAEIIRDGDEEVRTRFDLKAIQAGKAADPLIKPRDRIILH